jgi:glutathione S-transferase
MNIYLKNETYLVANRITLADIFLSLMIFPLYHRTLESEFFIKEVPNVTDWLESLIKFPEFVSCIGTHKNKRNNLPPDKNYEGNKISKI